MKLKINPSRKIINFFFVFITAAVLTAAPYAGNSLFANKSGEQLFSLNFKDVDIKEFIHIMSEVIKKNIVIDDAVRGTITINSSRRIPVKDAYDVMKSILELKGFSVIESQNLIKIVPIKDAIRQNIQVILDGDDITMGADDTATYLLELKHSEASRVQAALNPIKGKHTDIIVYEPLNILIISGTIQEIQGLRAIASNLDREIPLEDDDIPLPKGNIHVVHLENSNAAKMAAVLGKIPFEDTIIREAAPEKKVESRAARRVTATQARDEQRVKLSIVADEETNSLIVTAVPEEFQQIKKVIDKLDTVRDQVLIEALILEVQADSGWEFGIDWMAGDQRSPHAYGGSFIRGIPDFSGMDKTGTPIPLRQDFQLGYIHSQNQQLLGFALLNASGRDDYFNVLSTPQILTINNNEAELNIGEEIAVPSDSRITDAGTQFYTYDYKSVGIKLKITPHITKQGRITLDLYQEVNQVGTRAEVVASQIIPPDLLKRDIKTRVTVIDGQTIVVGGLMRTQKEVTERKVPVLGDIPLLGWFFKRKTEYQRKTNLLVFITPRIVTDHKELERISDEQRKQYQPEN